MWPKLYGPDFFISRGAPLRDVPLVCLCQKGKCETTNTGGALSHSAPLRCKNSRGAPGRDVPPLCGVKIDTRDHQNPWRTRRQCVTTISHSRGARKGDAPLVLQGANPQSQDALSRGASYIHAPRLSAYQKGVRHGQFLPSISLFLVVTYTMMYTVAYFLKPTNSQSYGGTPVTFVLLPARVGRLLMIQKYYWCGLTLDGDPKQHLFDVQRARFSPVI